MCFVRSIETCVAPVQGGDVDADREGDGDGARRGAQPQRGPTPEAAARAGGERGHQHASGEQPARGRR